MKTLHPYLLIGLAAVLCLGWWLSAALLPSPRDPAHPVPDAIVDAANGPAAPTSGRPDGGRVEVAPASVTIRLGVASLPGAVRLSAPRCKLTDPTQPQPLDLTEGVDVVVAAAPTRSIDAESVSLGWKVADRTIQVGSVAAGEVVMLPRNTIRLEVGDRDQGLRVPKCLVSIWTEEVIGCCPQRALVWQGEVDTSERAASLEGLPLRAGKFRIRVGASGHQDEVTDWIELREGAEHPVRLLLRRDSLALGESTVQVVDRTTGRVVAGAAITVVEATYEVPKQRERSRVASWYPSNGHLLPRFPGVDADFVPSVLIAATAETGEATFALRADVRYVIAVMAKEHASAWIDDHAITPGGRTMVTVELDAAAEIVGKVTWSDNDPALQGLRSVNYVELSSDRTTAAFTLTEARGFRFGDLAPGVYRLVACGVVGARDRLPAELASRKVHVTSGAKVEVDLPIGAAAGGAQVVGKVGSFPPLGWEWSAVYGPLGANSQPSARCDLSQAGEFVFAGVPAGDHFFCAVGRRRDGRGIGFGGKVVSVQGVAPHAIAIEIGPALEIVARDRSSPPSQARLALLDDDSVFSAILATAPPLIVGGSEPSVVLGLPAGKLRITTATSEQVVELPSAGPVIVD